MNKVNRNKYSEELAVNAPLLYIAASRLMTTGIKVPHPIGSFEDKILILGHYQISVTERDVTKDRKPNNAEIVKAMEKLNPQFVLAAEQLAKEDIIFERTKALPLKFPDYRVSWKKLAVRSLPPTFTVTRGI